MVQFLIENGADFHAVDDEGNSILHYACYSKDNINLLEYLFESGFDFTIQNKQSMTPLLIAIHQKNRTAAKFLIKNKAGLNVCVSNGDSPLHICAKNGEYDLMKDLILEGSDVNIQNENGETPLHLAYWFYNAQEQNDICELLLDNGAEINVLDKNGDSPFYCSLYGQISNRLIRRFLDDGADLTIKYGRGHNETILNLVISRISYISKK